MKTILFLTQVTALFLSAVQSTYGLPAITPDAATPDATTPDAASPETPATPINGLVSATATCFPRPSVPIGAGGGPFATRSGRMFQIQSKVQYFAGANAWWLGHLQSNADVDNTLTQFAQSQLKVARVWGFGNTNDAVNNPSYNVYYQALNSTGQYFNFDQNTGIPRLDYVVSAAEKKGVKLVLPLLNNFDGLGGINVYTNALGCSHASFYSDPKCQAAYKNYIKFIVNRYKRSTAVFAWELCNEPRCSNCPTSVITNWASSISAYIKSLDSAHLVALGDEGWLTAPYGDGSYAYSGYEGVDFATNLAIKTIDYGTFHAYPDSWGYNDSWVNTWITQHNAVGKALGKPVVFEEYGSTLDADAKQTVVKPWQETVRVNTSLAFDSFWQFGTTLTSEQPFDNYAIYYNTTAGSDYQVLAIQHAAAMLAKAPVVNQ